MKYEQFATYVKDNWERFVNYVLGRSRLRNRQDAENIVQEVIVKCLPRRWRLRRDTVDRYILRSLNNEIVSFFRRHRMNEPLPEQLPARVSPAHHASREELWRLFERYTGRLTDLEFRAMTAWWSAEGDRQVALQLLGLPAQSKSCSEFDGALHRARRKMCEFCKKVEVHLLEEYSLEDLLAVMDEFFGGN
jgi:hypothetical protein